MKKIIELKLCMQTREEFLFQQTEINRNFNYCTKFQIICFSIKSFNYLFFPKKSAFRILN
jgi:hypothetical protein